MKISLFDKQFNFLLREFGEDIYLNNSPTRAIFSQKDKTLNIYTKEKLKAGDTIFYDNYYWYIMMEGTNNENYSGSFVGKAEWFVNLYPTKLKNSTDPNIAKAVRIPAFLNQSNLTKVWDAVLPYLVGKLDIVVKSIPTTQAFEINDRFIKFGRAWKCISKNESQAGFIKFSFEFEALGANDNTDLEIPDGFSYNPVLPDMTIEGFYPDAKLNRPFNPSDDPYNPDIEIPNYELRFEDDNGYEIKNTEYSILNSHNIQYVKIYKDGVFYKNLMPSEDDSSIVSSNDIYLSVRRTLSTYQLYVDDALGTRPYGYTITVTAYATLEGHQFSASHEYTTIQG